jgi:hypothetical protein
MQQGIKAASESFAWLVVSIKCSFPLLIIADNSSKDLDSIAKQTNSSAGSMQQLESLALAIGQQC